jgi:hypothetical protein
MKAQLLVISLFMVNIARADLVSSTLAGAVANPATINAGDYGGNGREFKANDAANQANNGQQAADGTGAALMAAAIPMLASPILSVQMAGVTLMGMAGAEFAQGAADNQAAQQNGNQYSMLTSGDGQQGTSLDDTPSTSTPSLSPALQDLLNSMGVDPYSFATQMGSGQLSTPQSVAQALGIDPGSADDPTTSQLVTTALNNLGLDNTTPQVIDNGDEDAVTSSDSGDSGSGSSAQSGSQGGAPSFGGASDITGIGSQPQTAAGATPRGLLNASQEASHSGEAAAEAVNPLAQYLNGVGAVGAEAAEKIADSPAGKNFMITLGIQKPKGTENIFSIAHRNYRGYSRWRKQSKVAMR